MGAAVMTWFRRFLLAGASLLAMTASAQAEFIITPIAFALFAGPLGAVASVGAIYTGVQIALLAGLAIGSSLLSRQQQQKVDPGAFKSTFSSSESSEINAIGRVGISGLKAFGNTKGSDKSRLVAHARGPLKAVEEYKLGGREVTVDPDGAVSSPPYAKPGGSWVNWKIKDGVGADTAWADLMSDFPSLWTADHTLPGVINSLIRYTTPGFATTEAAEKHQVMYGGGEPDGMIVGRFNHVYDPREVGADPDDEETFVWSMNGPLCAARIMSFYPDLTMASFDWDVIADEADKADVLVDTLTGTEPRSRISGVWLSEAERGSTMQDVLDSAGLEIVQSDEGLIRIRLIDDAPTAEVSIAAKDIVDFGWKSGPEAVERPNVCRIRYYSAERNYEMADIDMSGIGWARIDDEITRYGEKPIDISLPFCPSASQAQRIARRLFLLARADAGQVATNWVGAGCWEAIYTNIELPDLDETALTKIAPPRIDDAAATVDIPYVVWPQDLIDDPWDPATMEAAAPEDLPDLQNESELDTPDAPTEATVVVYPNGNREMRMKFSGVTGGTIAEANFRTYTGGLPNAWQATTEYEGVSGAWYGWKAFGTNLTLNRMFSADANWTKGTGWTISGGKAVGAAGSASALTQSLTLTTGKTYRTELTMSDRTAGTLRMRLQGGTNVNGSLLSVDGRYKEDLVAVSGNNAFGIVKSSDFAGKADDACVYDMSDGFIDDGIKADFRARFFNAEEEASYFSDIFDLASLNIDNTTPGAPTASGVNVDTSLYSIEVTARAPELRVVRMLVEEMYTEPSVGFGWRTLVSWDDVRPDVNRVVSTTEVGAGPDDATLSWRVSSFTSDGTQGPYTSGSRVITGTGGP